MSYDTLSAGTSHSRFVLVSNREFPQCAPYCLAGETHQPGVIALLYDRSPDAWLRTWQSLLGDESSIIGMVTVGAGRRGAAASTTPPQPASRSPPSLTAVESPADSQTLERAIQSYLDAWPAAAAQRILWIESLTAAVQQTSLTAIVELLDALQPWLAATDTLAYLVFGSDADGAAERLRTALLSGERPSAAAPDQPLAVSASLVAEVGRELAALRRADPATYARLESHWPAVKTGLERTELNYAKAHQIYRTLEEPSFNVQTLGRTLNGLAALGVLNVWDGQTNGPNRYDLTSYDPARFAAVSIHLDAATQPESSP